jgi:dTDP-4-dehydrorhamnose reductase
MKKIHSGGSLRKCESMANSARWLITGGGGQLARELLAILDERGAVFKSYSSEELDIRDQLAVHNTIEVFAPTFILNCAAWTNVDLAEKNEQSAFDVNARGVKNLAIAANSIGAHLTHYSTDYVFDGLKRTPYEVGDIKDPKTAYGRSKSAGEDFLMSLYPEKSLIIRTAWLYSEFGSNFLKTILNLEKTQKNIYVVSDQIGQPTSAADLALFTLDLLERDSLTGLHHGTNSGETSWFGFAQEIFKIVGADVDRVVPVPTEMHDGRTSRPNYSVLSLNSWEELGITPMRRWNVALEDIISGILKKDG